MTRRDELDAQREMEILRRAFGALVGLVVEFDNATAERIRVACLDAAEDAKSAAALGPDNAAIARFVAQAITDYRGDRTTWPEIER